MPGYAPIAPEFGVSHRLHVCPPRGSVAIRSAVIVGTADLALQARPPAGATYGVTATIAGGARGYPIRRTRSRAPATRARVRVAVVASHLRTLPQRAAVPPLCRTPARARSRWCVARAAGLRAPPPCGSCGPHLQPCAVALCRNPNFFATARALPGVSRFRGDRGPDVRLGQVHVPADVQGAFDRALR